MAQTCKNFDVAVRQILLEELRDLGLLPPSPAPGNAPPAPPAPPQGEDGSGAPLPPGGAPETPGSGRPMARCTCGSFIDPCWSCGADRPWYDDPREIAALARWLGEDGTAYFVENVHVYSEERERMVREQGRVTDR